MVTTITAKGKFDTHQFSIILGILQVLFLIIFWIFSEHNANVLPPQNVKTPALNVAITDHVTQINYTG